MVTPATTPAAKPAATPDQDFTGPNALNTGARMGVTTQVATAAERAYDTDTRPVTRAHYGEEPKES